MNRCILYHVRSNRQLSIIIINLLSHISYDHMRIAIHKIWCIINTGIHRCVYIYICTSVKNWKLKSSGIVIFFFAVDKNKIKSIRGLQIVDLFYEIIYTFQYESWITIVHRNHLICRLGGGSSLLSCETEVTYRH